MRKTSEERNEPKGEVRKEARMSKKQLAAYEKAENAKAPAKKPRK